MRMIYRSVSEETIYHGYLCRTNIPKDSITLQEGETIAYRWVTEEEFMAIYEQEDQFPFLLKERMKSFVANGFRGEGHFVSDERE